MEDKLIELLQSLCDDVIRQGSLGPDEEYPNRFFTFWNNDESEHSAYDNATANVVHNFDVNAYSTDAADVYTMLRSARKLLRKNGWVTLSRGHDVASDELTHTGRGMTVIYLKNEN